MKYQMSARLYSWISGQLFHLDEQSQGVTMVVHEGHEAIIEIWFITSGREEDSSGLSRKRAVMSDLLTVDSGVYKRPERPWKEENQIQQSNDYYSQADTKKTVFTDVKDFTLDIAKTRQDNRIYRNWTGKSNLVDFIIAGKAFRFPAKKFRLLRGHRKQEKPTFT